MARTDDRRRRRTSSWRDRRLAQVQRTSYASINLARSSSVRSLCRSGIHSARLTTLRVPLSARSKPRTTRNFSNEAQARRDAAVIVLSPRRALGAAPEKKQYFGDRSWFWLLLGAGPLAVLALRGTTLLGRSARDRWRARGQAHQTRAQISPCARRKPPPIATRRQRRRARSSERFTWRSKPKSTCAHGACFATSLPPPWSARDFERLGG